MDGEGQLPFDLASVVEEARGTLTHKSEVEFTVAHEGRKEIAVGISPLPAGTIVQEERLEGKSASCIITSLQRLCLMLMSSFGHEKERIRGPHMAEQRRAAAGVPQLHKGTKAAFAGYLQQP